VVLLSIIINILLFLIVYFISNTFLAFLSALIVLYAVVKFIDKKKGFA